MKIIMRHAQNVGYVEIKHRSVHVTDLTFYTELLDAVHWAEALWLERVLVSGHADVFAAGAELPEKSSPSLSPQLSDVLNAIDQSVVPWIAVITGTAFGEGAEIALACRLRIMAPEALIGLTQVTVGLIPGAGGTQRLPRLVGLANALDIIASGQPLSASTAHDIGLVQVVEDNPIDAAFMINTEALGSVVPAQDLPPPAIESGVINAAREQALLKTPGQIAPLRAIDVIEAGLKVPFQQGLALERQAFIDLVGTDQAIALRHLCLAQRCAKAPADPILKPRAPLHVAVVGGGTMGSAIAYALLNAGGRVTVLERDDDGIQCASATIESIVTTALGQGVIDEAGAAARRERLVVSSDYTAIGDATLAIESVLERLDVKLSVFAALEHALPDNAIIASTTSTLDLNQIAACVANPSRVVGLHFFAPAHITKLLEIVRGDYTSKAALSAGFEIAEHLGKIPVVVGDCDGFVGNRIMARYHEAADTLLMDGSTPWEVDEAMVEFGYALGPYAEQDITGLDIVYANRRRQDATRNPARRYIPIADRMVELGKLGRKTAAGWYRYPGGNGRVEDPIVADLGIEEAYFAGIERVDYSAEEIRERLVLAMINEAADLLDEGIVQCASDIDLVTVFGSGFPPWRGGLMHYADSLGAKWIVAQLEKLCEEDPLVWKISPLLSRCAQHNQSIAQTTNTPKTKPKKTT